MLIYTILGGGQTIDETGLRCEYVQPDKRCQDFHTKILYQCFLRQAVSESVRQLSYHVVNPVHWMNHVIGLHGKAACRRNGAINRNISVQVPMEIMVPVRGAT